MPVRRYKPTTPGRRLSSVDTFEDITAKKPLKKLTKTRKRSGGRTKGKITVRHRGGGAKRRIRIIDFKRTKFDIPAKVATIEYDPNRGARVALLHYADGEKSYILAPVDLKVGDTIVSSMKRQATLTLHNIELKPGKGGQLARGAGSSVQLMAVEGKYATLKLPSSEVRMVLKTCMATIGQSSNPDYRLIRWGKAGRTRHRGIRPTVRGKAMNPVDHPHGGGEAANSIGLKNPKTPKGKPALGVRTRRKRASDKMIVRGRKRGRFVGGKK